VHAISPRIAAVAIWSFIALAPLGAAGCHVGASSDSPGDSTGDSPSVDASGGGGGGADQIDGGGGGGASGDLPTECATIATDVTDTGHHPERYDFDQGSHGCISTGCHDGSSAGPPYTIAGALYDQRSNGGKPLAGAKVYVKDADGKVVEMTTAKNGFFYSQEAVNGTLTALASGCPTFTPMLGPANGNCNLGQCHGENIKVYLGAP